MLSRFAQMRLEFAEGQLDRVEVRRILRKIRLCSNMTGICLKASNPASSESYVSSLKGPNPMPQGPSQSRSSI